MGKLLKLIVMKEYQLLKDFIKSTVEDKAKREELIEALDTYGMEEYREGYSAGKSYFDKS
jgi:hypothetical protein